MSMGWCRRLLNIKNDVTNFIIVKFLDSRRSGALKTKIMPHC